MSTFMTFLELGLRHIADFAAMDHMLFLLALAAIYRFSEWRSIVWVITAFTVGHSMTLAAAVLGYQPLSQPVVEFLIPLTIVATCMENIVVRDRSRAPLSGKYRPVLAVLFGLVHGAGFGGYLKGLFVEDVALPLFGFNIGIELGQIAVLVVVFGLMRLIDTALRLPAGRRRVEAVIRMRVVGISAVVMLIATGWAFERAPW